jgi:hypothetical protein
MIFFFSGTPGKPYILPEDGIKNPGVMLTYNDFYKDKNKRAKERLLSAVPISKRGKQK